MNLERTPTSRTTRARYAPLLERVCVFILIYIYIYISNIYYILLNTHFPGIYNKKWAVASRAETRNHKNQNFAFLRISFSIHLRSARPQSPHPRLPIFIFIQKYTTIHIQKKRKTPESRNRHSSWLSFVFFFFSFSTTDIR